MTPQSPPPSLEDGGLAVLRGSLLAAERFGSRDDECHGSQEEEADDGAKEDSGFHARHYAHFATARNAISSDSSG